MQDFSNDSEAVLDCFETETPPVVVQKPPERENKKIVDISKITGRNLITGQKITLDGYMDKIMEQNERELDLAPHAKRSNKKPTGTSYKTESGKRLVGKIVSIEKKIYSTEIKSFTMKKESMSRDVFDYVSKMLVGLMSMESVCKKLSDKSLNIKVVEKTVATKEISRLCGFMAITEAGLWKFFPLKGIAGEEYKSVAIEDFSDDDFYCENPYFESTSLTMIISTEANGRRTMRVNLTPNNSKRTKTSGNNTFKCEYCEKSFKSVIQYESHKALHCNICGKSFTYQTNLKRHLAQHVRGNAFFFG